MTRSERPTAPPSWRARYGPAAGGLSVAVLGSLVYCATRARHVGWGDNGELAAAAWVLGIPHTPGYPLWTPLAKAFSSLPLGIPAARLALFSCVCGAACCGLLAYWVGRTTLSVWAGVAGGLLLASTPNFWDQATTVEVYPLAMFLLVLLWALAGPGGAECPPEEPPPRRRLLLFAFVYGLSAGSHMMLITLAPAFLYLLWRQGALRRTNALALVFFALGLAVFLYLPLRAAQQPPINFGDPSNWPRFLAHVSGQASRLHMFEIPFPEMWQRVEGIARLVIADFTWLGLGLAATGWLSLIWRNWTLWVFLSLIKLISLTVTANYNIIDNEVYLLPYYVCEGALAGFGAAFLAGLAARLFRRLRVSPVLGAAAALALAIAIPLGAFAANFRAMDKSADFSAADFEAAALDNADPNAVLITDWWLGGPLLYGRFVEQRRTDVTVLPLFSKWRPWERFNDLALGTAFGGRPVYVGDYLTDSMRTVENLVHLAPAGPLYRVYWLPPDLRAPAGQPAYPHRLAFAPGLTFLGASAQRAEMPQGGSLKVQLWWEVAPDFPLQEMRLRYALDAQAGSPRVWRGDSMLPVSATRGLLVDEQVIGPLTDAPPGDYRLVALINDPTPRSLASPLAIEISPRPAP